MPGAGTPQKFARACRPQTNGKTERFIQFALRRWVYRPADENSCQRLLALPVWNHFSDGHRCHEGSGCLPTVSRLPAARKFMLTLHR